MNKKGFTLIELLATIVILSLIITIVATKGFGAFDKSKTSISKLDEKSIKEAARVLKNDIEYCEDDNDEELLNELNNANIKKDPYENKVTCASAKESLSECFSVSLQYLIDNEYITGNNLTNYNDVDIIKICEDEITLDSLLEFKNGPIEKNSLAYNIVENIIRENRETKFVLSPSTKIGEQSSTWETGTYKNTSLNDLGIQYLQGLLYGDTLEESINRNREIDFEMEMDPNICVNLKGKYLAQNNEGIIESIGKIVDCNNNTPIIEKKVIDGEKELLSAEDDLGTSYYYRGMINDNYLNYNNMCWRIVRIEGDGAIEIILADEKATCSEATLSKQISAFPFEIYGEYGSYQYNSSYLSDFSKSYTYSVSGIKEKLDKWFESKIIDAKKIKNRVWCIEETTKIYDIDGNVDLTNKYNLIIKKQNFYYDSYRRINNKMDQKVTLNCKGKTLESKIGTLTADEVIFAGAKLDSKNANFFLTDNAKDTWTTLTSSQYLALDCNKDLVYNISKNGKIYSNTCDESVRKNSYYRPVVSLIPSIKFKGGNGTVNNPYVVE